MKRQNNVITNDVKESIQIKTWSCAFLIASLHLRLVETRRSYSAYYVAACPPAEVALLGAITMSLSTSGRVSASTVASLRETCATGVGYTEDVGAGIGAHCVRLALAARMVLEVVQESVPELSVPPHRKASVTDAFPFQPPPGVCGGPFPPPPTFSLSVVLLPSALVPAVW